jgi:fumarate reductase iron-sulfur subunit
MKEQSRGSSPRTLTFEIFRFNPEDPESKPHTQIFELEEEPFMCLYIALNRIREQFDPSLQFDFTCRESICGACGMIVNGRPALGCKTLTNNLPEHTEEKMSDELSQAIYEGDRCIECGCCIAACGVANVDPEFLGAAGLNRVARFIVDPRDKRTDSTWFEIVAGEQGVFACFGMMACEDICPKDLPLLEVNAYLRRKMLASRFADSTS